MSELDVLKIVGLGLTLHEYQREVLNGYPPYYEGTELKFECTACGQCCVRPGLVYLTEEDIEKIAEFFKMTAEEVKISMLERSGSDWVIQVDKEADCLFFRDDKCRIHTAKPTQCMTYPFWPELVGERSAWRRERQFCPGIGQGKSYQAEEVREMLFGLCGTSESEPQ